MTINFIQRKSFKQKVWKTLNIIVGVTTILNVSLVGSLIRPLPAQALSDTGYLNPSTNANLNPTVTNPANANTQNDADAVFNDTSNHRYGGFNISVPPGQSVVGIEVKVRAKRASGSGTKNLNVYLTDNNGSSWGSSKNADGFGGSYSTVTLGGSSDLWGRTAWDASEISNANFAVRIQNDFSSGTVGVDHVAVKVHYGGYTFEINSPTPPAASQTYVWTIDGSKPASGKEISHVDIAGCWSLSDINQAASSSTDGTLVFNADGSVKIDSLQDTSLPTTLTLTFNESSPSTGTATATIKAGNSKLQELVGDGPNCNPQPVPNPPLGQSCGLDISLVIDRSGSMDSMSNEVTPMRDALVGFVDAFTGTPTDISVVEFSTTASVIQPFTSNIAAAKTAINSELNSLGSGTTNWEDALSESFGTFDPRPAKPNLLVVATDGSPNTYNTSGGTNFSWTDGNALGQATEQANLVKNAGTRIVVIGIGQDETDPDFNPVDPTWNNPKLAAISGLNIAPPNAVAVTTDVIKTDFDQLSSSMSQLAKALCGGKIIVQKQFDTNNDGTADLDGSTPDHRLAGWEFDIHHSPSADPPTAQTTTNSGSLEFEVLNGTYSLIELNQKPNTKLTSIECLKSDQSVGTVDLVNRTVSNLNIGTDETISCRFVNSVTSGDLKIIKHVINDNLGTATASDFTMHVQQNGSDVVTPFAGSESGTTSTLPAGIYEVSETGLPSGYIQTSIVCNGQPTNVVAVEAGATKTCTITNDDIGPVITVDKTGPATVVAGENLAYTLAWTVGPAPVTNAIVTDTVPANTAFVSAGCGTTAGACTINSATNTISWNLGSRNPGESGNVTVTVKTNSPLPNGTMITNTGTFDTDQTDPVSDTVTTTVAALPVLGLQKSANPATVPADTTTTWTIKWTVSGNTNATALTIVDPIPTNMIFHSAADGGIYNPTTNSLFWNLGTQAPGASGEVHFVTRAVRPITNNTIVTNTATIDSAETDPPLSASASVTVTSAPDLTVAKVSDVQTFTNPGKAITYSVTVTNKATATDTAKNVVLTDKLPAGFTFAVDGATTKSFVVGNLTPGQSATITYLVNISGTQAAGTFDNLAKAKGDNTNEVSAVAPVEVRVPVVLGIEALPDLTIAKTVSPTTAKPGDIVTYTITVRNTGDADATNVVITDTLPPDLSFVHAKGRTMTWELGTLEPGRSRVIDVDVRVESDAKNGDYVNVATVAADELPAKETQAKLTVRVPKVRGLATTGPGTIDFVIAMLGFALVALGLLGLRRRPLAADKSAVGNPGQIW